MPCSPHRELAAKRDREWAAASIRAAWAITTRIYCAEDVKQHRSTNAAYMGVKRAHPRDEGSLRGPQRHRLVAWHPALYG